MEQWRVSFLTFSMKGLMSSNARASTISYEHILDISHTLTPSAKEGDCAREIWFFTSPRFHKWDRTGNNQQAIRELQESDLNYKPGPIFSVAETGTAPP